jgi:hypothetical protein
MEKMQIQYKNKLDPIESDEHPICSFKNANSEQA